MSFKDSVFEPLKDSWVRGRQFFVGFFLLSGLAFERKEGFSSFLMFLGAQSVDEVVEGSDPWGIIGFKAGEDGKEGR